MNYTVRLVAVVLGLALVVQAAPQTRPAYKPGPGDQMILAWLNGEVEAIANKSLAEVKSLEDWNAKHAAYRGQLAEMLGLSPMPEKTDLKTTITGRVEHAQFTVENLHFQSRPGLYVTGNLYVPKGLKKPAPTILYVCGHGNVKKDGVSYGAKAAYQHWGAWFARNGYVCLVIDTLQLGEIEGIHHGTYRYGMWWWHSRGYTPAGVEAWNAIRALDYLCSRPEVDKEKLGVTGRSGGGAYSWWLSTLDDRIKAAVPTAGITDLQNHVVDGCVEGHCDCMYMVNTYRWDYAQVAALVAPRALLLENTDKDNIFPLDGVYRIHNQVRRIYELSGSAMKNFSLTITEGPHKDTQALQVPAFHWFRRHFDGNEAPIENVATKLFEPEQLRVFKQLPADQINTKIQETFVPMTSSHTVPQDKAQWEKLRDGWMANLKAKSFAAWPQGPAAKLIEQSKKSVNNWDVEIYRCGSEGELNPTLYMVSSREKSRFQRILLHVLTETEAGELLSEIQGLGENGVIPGGLLNRVRVLMESEKTCLVYLAPRGVGPLALTADERKRTQILRRFYLVGTTLEAMQAYDVRRAVQAIRSTKPIGQLPLSLEASGPMAGVALYASLFEPGIEQLTLRELPETHMEGPHFLNVLRFMNMPAAVAMAAERSKVRLISKKQQPWDYPRAVAAKLGWSDAIEIVLEGSR